MIALTKYGQVQGETASPERQLTLLFEAARGHIRTGIAEFEKGQPLVGSRSLLKASKIVNSLMSVLKPSVAPEFCAHLGKVYGFVCLRLNLAVAKKNVALAREAEKVFEPVAAGFIEAVRRSAEGP